MIIPEGDHRGPQHHANRNAERSWKTKAYRGARQGPHRARRSKGRIGPGANVSAWRIIKAMRSFMPNPESGYHALSPQAARRALKWLIVSCYTT